MQRADCAQRSTPCHTGDLSVCGVWREGGPGTNSPKIPRDNHLSFGGVRSYTRIFDCVEGRYPYPHVVLGSTVVSVTNHLRLTVTWGTAGYRGKLSGTVPAGGFQGGSRRDHGRGRPAGRSSVPVLTPLSFTVHTVGHHSTSHASLVIWRPGKISTHSVPAHSSICPSTPPPSTHPPAHLFI